MVTVSRSGQNLRFSGQRALGFAYQSPALPFSLALKALSLPFSLALKVLSLPFSLALKALGLLFVPGSEALHHARPVLLPHLSQRPQHDGADSQPLPQTAALQQAKQHSCPDQQQRRQSLNTRGPRLPGLARRRVPEARLPVVCGQLALTFSFRPPAAGVYQHPRRLGSRHHP